MVAAGSVISSWFDLITIDGQGAVRPYMAGAAWLNGKNGAVYFPRVPKISQIFPFFAAGRPISKLICCIFGVAEVRFLSPVPFGPIPSHFLDSPDFRTIRRAHHRSGAGCQRFEQQLTWQYSTDVLSYLARGFCQWIFGSGFLGLWDG